MSGEIWTVEKSVGKKSYYLRRSTQYEWNKRGLKRCSDQLWRAFWHERCTVRFYDAFMHYRQVHIIYYSVDFRLKLSFYF